MASFIIMTRLIMKVSFVKWIFFYPFIASFVTKTSVIITTGTSSSGKNFYTDLVFALATTFIAIHFISLITVRYISKITWMRPFLVVQRIFVVRRTLVDLLLFQVTYLRKWHYRTTTLDSAFFVACLISIL